MILAREDFHTMDNQNTVYQEYLRLQSQHDSIRESLDTIRTSPASSFSADSTTTSPSLSPTRGASADHNPYSPRGSRQASPTAGGRRHHRDYQTLDAVFTGSGAAGEVAEQEQRLLSVNEGIKRALTELLNCDVVRADKPFRMWVQCRLMETEKELRSRRRTRRFVV